MQTVEAQPVRAPRTGLALLIAAPQISDAGFRWLDGFRWQPEVRVGSSAIGVTCNGSTASRTPAAQPSSESFEPFLAWAAEKCSTKGSGVRDFKGRARRALESELSFLVAREFWNGAEGGGRYLADENAEVLTSGAVPPAVALTYVDSALTRRLRNRQGMVNMRPELVDVLVALDLLRYEAGSLFTPLGHVVVADAGYSGDGHDGTDPVPADESSQWMVGTDLIGVRLGPVEDLPEGDAVSPENVDRATNDLVVWAQRLVGIQWDHHAQVSAQVEQGALT